MHGALHVNRYPDRKAINVKGQGQSIMFRGCTMQGVLFCHFMPCHEALSISWPPLYHRPLGALNGGLRSLGRKKLRMDIAVHRYLEVLSVKRGNV